MATLGPEIPAELIYTNVTDQTAVYNNTVMQNFEKDITLQSGTKTYNNTSGQKIIIKEYDSQADYAVGNIAYKDGAISILEQGDGITIPRMPSEYSAHDATLDSSAWANRYVYLGENTLTYPEIHLEVSGGDTLTGVNGVLSTTVNNGEYTYHYAATSKSSGSLVSTDTGLKDPTLFNTISYTVSSPVGGWNGLEKIALKDGDACVAPMPYSSYNYASMILAHGYDFSSIPNNATIKGVEIQITKKGGSRVKDSVLALFQGSTIKGINIASASTWSGSLTTVTYGGPTNLLGWTNITPADVKSNSFTIGFEVSNATIYNDTAYIDSIQVKIYYQYQQPTAWSYSTTAITAVRKIDNNNVLTETAPTIHGDSPYACVFHSVIQDGTSIYARTNVSTSVYTKQEDTVWVTALTPDMIGFEEIGYINQYKPFDGANATPAVFGSPMRYTIKGLENFNAFALARVLASQVTYTFKLPDGTIVKTATATLNCKCDPDGIIKTYPTSRAFYAGRLMPPNSTVEIELIHTDTIQLGDFTLNTVIRGGFTRPAFSYNFIDFNDNTPNPWGQIPQGNKPVVLKYNITIAMYIWNNDEYVSFLQSILQKFIIIDGSDSDGRDPDGETVLGSLIRRVKVSSVDGESTVVNNRLGKTIEIKLSVQEIV